ncbi:unnamed protein product [Caenorhabditis auriculariae]|uniref:Nonsense-mediated mRNA decay factor SMG8 n=1 Tax=Caenorhabditis auriculariae TaxID=2777116 RepID=A0A8S1HL19_9PELO|nr:unnamed protein product [Caenorhabditis auriculariae]
MRVLRPARAGPPDLTGMMKKDEEQNLRRKVVLSKSLLDWIDFAGALPESQLRRNIKVMGIFGKDSPERGIGEDINNFVRTEIFPMETIGSDKLKIKVYYSAFDNTLFLLLNGADYTNSLLEVFSNEKSNGKTFFEKMRESEDMHCRSMYFMFLTCHFLVFLEPSSRLDLGTFRSLRRLNALRLNTRSKVQKKLESLDFGSDFDGRLAVPRLLFGFLRNTVRSDLGSSRRREIYEKLEESLDLQLSSLLKSFGLTEAGSKSLCQLNEKLPVVHLINPASIKRDILAEVFESCLPNSTFKPAKVASSSFSRFLDDNFKSLGGNLPTLQQVVSLFDCLKFVLDPKEFPIDITFSTPELKFAEKAVEDHMLHAVTLYEKGNEEDTGHLVGGTKKVRSKAEHDQLAVAYLKAVSVGDVDKELARLRDNCDLLWEQGGFRGCEQKSLTGALCALPMHPCIGDATTVEEKWLLHTSKKTLLSTCACGYSQALRSDPFTVKEANCDFFELTRAFTCCKRLQRFHFTVFRDDDEDKEDWSNWAGPKSNSLIDEKAILIERRIHRKSHFEDFSGADNSTEEEDEDSDDDASPNSAEEMENHRTCSRSSEEQDVTMTKKGSYLDEEDNAEGPNSAANNVRVEPSSRSSAIEFAQRLKKLESSPKKGEYFDGVPNTVTSGRLPLFPSWILTCIGASRLYSHSTGLRRMPNFKIGGEYLTPVVVHLQVDMIHWNRDLDALQNVDDYGNEVIGKQKFVRRRQTGDEIARVKLFVGFEYECLRGHRFFVNHQGEPLIFPRGSHYARERDSERKCNTEMLMADLPIRRPCTCKKLPLQVAQLSKVHVVTPKAPVVVTLQPTVEISEHQGQYVTGQEPLKLERAKYYILQLPTVYNGPSGTWTIEKNNENIGVWKGNAFQVSYEPISYSYW